MGKKIKITCKPKHHTHKKATELDKEGYREISVICACVYSHHHSSLLASDSSLMMIKSDTLIAHMQGLGRSALLYGYVTFRIEITTCGEKLNVEAGVGRRFITTTIMEKYD